MDIGNTANKLLSKVEDNAMVLSAAFGIYSRGAEAYPEPTDNLNYLVSYFTNFGLNPVEGGYGALGEAIGTVLKLDKLKYKLWDAPHVSTMMIKAGVGLYALGELGLINAKYKKIGKDIAKGSAIAAIIMPGSGPASALSKTINENAQAAPTASAMMQRYY